MTQDPSQTPPHQPPSPPEAATDSPAIDSPVENAAEETATDAALTDAALEDVPSVESQVQPTDSAAASAATVDVSANQPIAPPVPAPAATPPVSAPPASAPPAADPSSPPPSKAAALIRLVGQLWGIVLPLLVIAGRWAWQVLLVTLKWIREAWKVALPRIRTLLPEGWRKLPDWLLTTVAVTLLVFVLWLTAQLLPGKPPATAIDRPAPAVNTPAPAQPTAPLPDPARIAEIQEQVAKITDEYAEGLVQAVQAFQGDLLTVKLSDAWFTLDASSQSQLANQLLKRSHKLKFDALELTDAGDELLARSPVVGSKMVIYGRMRDEG